jgi:NAD(P)-dependent dehydrogenase (short-subunit alcohol dehydrogenase family)
VQPLAGKVALVTGGSSGIGLATARLLLEEGAAVTISGRDSARLDAAARDLPAGGAVSVVSGDVAQPAHAEAMVAETIKVHGGLDYLVCCAGIPGVTPLDELTESLWDLVIGVNLKGTYTVIRAAVPRMRTRGGGAIVTVASEAGLTGQPNLAAYCASKGGVVNMTRALALELISDNIRVNCLCPGITDTPMCEEEAMMSPDPEETRRAWASWAPARRWADPLEQAKAILYLLRDATFAVGAILSQDGGFTAQ